MQLNKIVRPYKNLIIMAVGSLLAIAGIVFGVVPLAQKTIALAGGVRALTAEVDLLRRTSATLQLLDEATLRRSVLTLASAVPSDKSLPSILTTLDTVSGGSGIALTDVSLTKPGSLATESAKKLTRDEVKIGANLLPFSVSGRGTFEQVQSFLTSVVSVRRMFRLRSMSVLLSGGLSTVLADLDAYYFPYPTTVGPATGVSGLTEAEEKTITSIGLLPLSSVTSVSTISASAPSGKNDPFTP